MRYGIIFERFWDTPDIKALSDQGQKLACYLLTCKHHNMIGCYALTLEYMGFDLRWSQEVLKAALKELIAISFVRYDSAFSWVIIPNYLVWNEIQNKNHAKAAYKLLKAVPQKSAVFPAIIEVVRKEIRKHPDKFPDDYLRDLQDSPDAGATGIEGHPIPTQYPPQPSNSNSNSSSIKTTATQASPSDKRKGKRIPPDFAVTEDHRVLGRKLGVDPDRELPAFRDHFESKSGPNATKLDWNKTFNNWLRTADRYKPKPEPQAQPVAAPQPKREPAPRVVVPADINNSDQARKGWAAILSALKGRVDQRAFKTWLEPIRVLGTSGGALYVEAVSADVEVIEREYAELIGVAAEGLGLSRVVCVPAEGAD
jgi:hypothetical protein